jgi:excisionase family DNA binding protein
VTNNLSGRSQSNSSMTRLLTADAVAESLDVSSKTVRRWIKSGDLPAYRLGGLVRVSEADLIRFLATRREA